MEDFLGGIGQSVFVAFGMFWQVLWSLILGLTISSFVQTQISKERITKSLGKEGFKETVLATFLGILSSSCSYAAASASKAFFKKGAGLIPSLAFLFSSTNLVIELGILLWLLLGWQFALAEWLGGILLIVIMSGIVKLTYPKKLVTQARAFKDQVSIDHDHSMIGSHNKIQSIAQNFVMEGSMLQKDLILGFIIAGLIATFVPNSFWSLLFSNGQPGITQLLTSSIIGVGIAILSFVCSIGNVPLAAILWTRGLSFGGVLSFLYADLIVIPLLDLYRRYYGTKMAVYIGVIFFVTMVLTGIIVDLIFSSLNLIPSQQTSITNQLTNFDFNYTFWLNLIFGSLAGYFIYLSKKNTNDHAHHH